MTEEKNITAREKKESHIRKAKKLALVTYFVGLQDRDSNIWLERIWKKPNRGIVHVLQNISTNTINSPFWPGIPLSFLSLTYLKMR